MWWVVDVWAYWFNASSVEAALQQGTYQFVVPGAMKPRREGLLPVIGIGPMLTQVVLIQQFVLHRRELRC